MIMSEIKISEKKDEQYVLSLESGSRVFDSESEAREWYADNIKIGAPFIIYKVLKVAECGFEKP